MSMILDLQNFQRVDLVMKILIKLHKCSIAQNNYGESNKCVYINLTNHSIISLERLDLLAI